MRDYAKGSPAFWSGDLADDIRGDPRCQAMAWYLITSPHSNMIGLYRLPSAYMIEDLGWPEAEILGSIQKLERYGFCSYDWAAKVVFVVEAARHEWTDEPNAKDNRVKALIKSAPKILRDLHRSPLVSKFYERYLPGWSEVIGSPPQGLTKGSKQDLEALRNDGSKPLPSPTEQGAGAGAGKEEGEGTRTGEEESAPEAGDAPPPDPAEEVNDQAGQAPAAADGRPPFDPPQTMYESKDAVAGEAPPKWAGASPPSDPAGGSRKIGDKWMQPFQCGRCGETRRYPGTLEARAAGWHDDDSRSQWFCPGGAEYGPNCDGEPTEQRPGGGGGEGRESAPSGLKSGANGKPTVEDTFAELWVEILRIKNASGLKRLIQGKAECLDLWKKLGSKRPAVAVAAAYFEAGSKSAEWNRENGSSCPMARKIFYHRRWEDGPESFTAAGKDNGGRPRIWNRGSQGRISKEMEEAAKGEMF